MQRTVENVFHLSRLASLLGPFFVDAEAGSLKLVGTMYGAKMDILEVSDFYATHVPLAWHPIINCHWDSKVV